MCELRINMSKIVILAVCFNNNNNNNNSFINLLNKTFQLKQLKKQFEKIFRL